MGSIVYTSYDYDALVEKLSEELLKQFRTQALREATVIVPNHTIAQWLSSEIAKKLGVCLNIQFVYLESFLEFQSNPTEKRENSQITWALDILDELKQNPKWLAGPTEQVEIETPQMPYAWEFSGLFHKYAEYRPEWLMDTRTSSWPPHSQSRLFAQLWYDIQSKDHASLHPFVRAIRQLSQGPSNASASPLEETVFLFGYWEISSTKWKLLTALYPSVNFQFFISIPSKTFLVDLTKSTMQLPLFSETTEELLNPRLRFLSKMVGRGRAFQAFLLDQDIETTLLESDLGSNHTLLNRLQTLLIDPDFQPRKPTQLKPDNSIQLHSCTSPRRELETAKARIQQLLLSDPTLKLEDIHLYAPNIESYIQWIPVVFSEEDKNTELSVSVRESVAVEKIPIFQATLSILDFIQSDWDPIRFKALTKLKPIQLHFDWTDSDADTIQALMNRAGFFDGKTSDSDSSSVRPAPYYSWSAAWDRLLQAYASDAPRSLESSHHTTDAPARQMELLEKLAAFIRELELLEQDFSSSQQLPLMMLDTIDSIPERFFPTHYREFEVTVLEKTIAEIRIPLSNPMPGEVTLSELTFLLKKNLPKLPLPNAFQHRSGIRFQSITAESIVPSRVKILLGMREGAFPKAEIKRGFDLMQSDTPQFGDPSAHDSQLYWFLHSLLMTRDCWISTYVGRDELNNNDHSPASILLDLIDTVNTVLPDIYNKPTSGKLLNIVIQPRFSYEPSVFSGDPQKTNYDRESYNIAIHLQKDRKSPSGPAEALLQPASEEPSSIMRFEDLLAFYTSPSKYFCEHTLGLSFSRVQEEDPENEPLLWALDPLTHYQINTTGLEALRLDLDKRKIREEMVERGLLPIGYTGDTLLESYLQQWEQWKTQIPQQTQIGFHPDEMTQTVVTTAQGSFSLPSFKLEPPRSITVLHAGEIKTKHEIEIMLWRLAICATSQVNGFSSPTLHLFGKGKCQSFEPIISPLEKLDTLLAFKDKFEFRPCLFFPETSHKAYEQWVKTRNFDPEHTGMQNAWHNDFSKAEADDPYHQIVSQWMGDIFTEELQNNARIVFECLEGEETA